MRLGLRNDRVWGIPVHVRDPIDSVRNSSLAVLMNQGIDFRQKRWESKTKIHHFSSIDHSKFGTETKSDLDSQSDRRKWSKISTQRRQAAGTQGRGRRIGIGKYEIPYSVLVFLAPRRLGVFALISEFV